MSTATPTGSVERNIELGFAVARMAAEYPELLDEIPAGSTVILIPRDDPSQAAENIELGTRAVHAGENVYFKYVETIEEMPR